MSVAELASASDTGFVAELPDKTMVATTLLVARYRRALAVQLGAWGRPATPARCGVWTSTSMHSQ